MSNVNEIRFHINNGGVTFSVEDEGNGPLVKVTADHFGHPTAATGVYLTPEGMRRLAGFFQLQAERAFSPSYTCAAMQVFAECRAGEATGVPADAVAR